MEAAGVVHKAGNKLQLQALHTGRALFYLSIFFPFHPLSFTQGGWGCRGLAQQSWAKGGPDEAALHHTEGDKRAGSFTPPHHSESSIEQNVFVVWEEAGGPGGN